MEDHPQIIERLIFAHIKATEYLNSNKEKWIDESLEFVGDRETLEIALGNIQLFWDINEEYMLSVENLALRMYELGFITKLPDVRDMFDLSFIENYRSENP